jgi:lipoprotein-anchoring transpeptidase ErfK/SrfK
MSFSFRLNGLGWTDSVARVIRRPIANHSIQYFRAVFEPFEGLRRHMGRTQGSSMFRVSALRSFVLAAIAGAALTASASAGPLMLGYAPQDARAVDTMTEPGQGFEQVSRFKRQVVPYYSHEAPGTIVIDTPNTFLYFVLGNNRALRYGIGVGREGFTWSGTETITRKAEWPDWTPPQEMIARQPYLPRFMAGGPSNPLGARAMYLGGTVYRIHGTNAPDTIGEQVSSGCIRLVNEDVTDLYGRVNVGTTVVVLPMRQRFEARRASLAQ